MLLTLLPLAGWAAEWNEVTTRTNISADWTVQLWEHGSEGVVVESASYIGTSVAPDVVLVKGNDYIKSTHFTVTWKNGEGATITAAEVVDVIPGGSYTVTVSGNDDDTYGNIPAANSTASFWVLKNTASFSIAPALHANQGWDGSALDLLNPAGTLENDFNENAKIEYSIDGGTNWAFGMPKATKAGEYAVYYRVVGNNNFNGIESTRIGGVDAVTKINGNSFVDDDLETTPTGKTDLVFTWDDTKNEPVALDLINPGSLISDMTAKGKLKYKVDDTEGWIYTVPKRSAAGNYTVKWMIEGDEDYGYLDRANFADIDVTIDKATPSINADAAAATGLSYNGAAKGLLSAEGTATKGATVKYMIKAPGAADFATAVAYADVKGQNAGDYKIKPVVVVDDNYYAVTPDDDDDLVITATIAQAPALTAAPTAIADLTWNNDAQVLIKAGAGTVNGIVEYALTTMEEPTDAQFDAATWVTSVNNDAVKGDDAKTYYAWYRVTNTNYVAVPPTAIANVKIAPKTVSIIVNNASKKYDATGNINALTVVAPATTKFTVTNAVEGAAVNVATLKYTGEGTGLGDDYKNANTYVGALTASADDVATLNGTWGTNYEYTVVPGNLIVEPRPIYVEAKGSTATFGEEYNISKDYIIKGGLEGDINAWEATAEQIAEFFTEAPVLTAPDATGTPVPVDEYELAFTAGTTAANYTMDLTKGDGENLNGYVIGDKKFAVEDDPTHKLVITVLPHTQKYTGVAESWANLEEGVDYVVSGLIAGDVITKKPTFTRSESDKFDVKYTTDPTPVVTSYTLSADGVEVTNKAAHYPGGIVYNNSTFTIEPVELTATVNQQSIAKQAGVEAANITAANGALDQDAWTVEGLVNDETKSVLGGALAVDNVGTTAGKTNISAPEFYNNGIKLTIARGNYTLKAGTEYGILRVIADETLEFDPNDAELAQKIEENKFVEAGDEVNVTFANRSLVANTWYTMVLPFEVKTTELVGALKNAEGKNVYAIVNRMNESTTATEINFTLEMNKIPANEPFLIKAAEDVNMQDVTFEDKEIVYDEDPSIEYGGNKFIGTYTAVTNLPTEYNTNDKHFGFLGNASYTGSKGNALSNIWYNAKLAGLVINPMEAYLHYAYNAEGNAPVITVEDFDFSNNTTAIKTLNTETMKAIEAEGMYNLNGMKLNSVPTQKGVYIINGKKVVIK